jgi:hypothetical protein
LLYSNLPNSSYKTLLKKLLFTPSNSIGNPHFNNLNYKILVNTNVLINIHAIDCDSKAWNKPLVFDLDRFCGSNSTSKEVKLQPITIWIRLSTMPWFGSHPTHGAI